MTLQPRAFVCNGNKLIAKKKKMQQPNNEEKGVGSVEELQHERYGREGADG